MDTARFIELNAGGDVAALALQASRYAGVDMPYALRQIAGRQAAERKIPLWAATAGLEYPAATPMEQCSSEQTARAKRRIVERIIAEGCRTSMADITGGMGVDFSFMAPLFGKATLVEHDEELCRLARRNMPLLGLPGAAIVCADGLGYISAAEPLTLIYADPSRRTSTGRRAYAMADCRPDIAAALPLIMSRCRYFVAKLSPMLDLKATAKSLAPFVKELHIIEAEGECKEILAVMAADNMGTEPTVYCHAPQREISVPLAECGLRGGSAPIEAGDNTFSYLYVPAKSVAKASCSPWIERTFGLKSVAPDSHLYLSTLYIKGFPGRVFSIDAITPVPKKPLRATMPGAERANIAVRNFPIGAAELRRRLRVADGGDTFIFATTAHGGRRLLLFCHKAEGRDTPRS